MPDEVVQTPFGKFLVNDQDVIESTLKAGTLWDGPGFLQPISIEHGRLREVGTTILDVGANVGAFSVWLASRGAWRVVAVEAVPQTFQRMLANLDLNRDVTADRVIPLNVAAYSRVAGLALGAPYDPTNVGGTTLILDPDGTIMGKPLDLYHYLFGTRVSLIKLDIQGCELAALQGLERTIDRDRPTIVLEWEVELATRHSHTLAALGQFLQALNYTLYPWPNRSSDYIAIPRRAA